MTPLSRLIEDFGFLDDWEDRMRYVIELGKALPGLPEEHKIADNKVQGCASQVWLVMEAEGGSDPVMRIDGDSDAFIVRGLVAIVLSAYEGKRASEIVAFDTLDLFSRLGLLEHLTAQRANGLRSMINRIREEAARHLG